MQGRDRSSRQAGRRCPASSGAPESGVHRTSPEKQPQLLEECRSGERSSAAILGHQGAGDIHGQDSKDNGVVSGVENSEVGTLLRVVGQAGLSRLGNDALAGVADDVQHIHHNVEGETCCHGP